MRATTLFAVTLLCVVGSVAADPPAEHQSGASARVDPYFGEAIYYADQGLYFEALQRLDAELGQYRALDQPKLDSLYHSLHKAEFSVGDFELSYRMHQRAGHAITAVLEGAVDEAVRNDAAYRLARMLFQSGQLQDALQALQRIRGRVPDDIKDDIQFLRANIYMGLKRPADAVTVLKRLQGSRSLNGFAAYNLGVALLEAGRRQDALAQFDRAGRVDGSDPSVLAIRDKSNYVLGSLLVDSGQFGRAEQYFDRVRLKGPFSDDALLASGWAAVSDKDFKRAVVPWSLLAKRETTDAAVEEAKLALPFAYGKLDVYGRAAVLYAGALNSFNDELKRLDASIESIRQGKFLKALTREEIRRNKDWVIRLRSLPESPETYYLMDLMASNDFQTGLQNYLDLADLRRKLASWQMDFDAFDDLIAKRRQYYEPLLPGIDSDFRKLDSRMRLRIQQHKLLDGRLQGMLVAPRPELLATVDERLTGERLTKFANSLDGVDTPDARALRQRIKRLQGVLTWAMLTKYDQRLSSFAQHLQELKDALGVLNERYESFVRTRQAAVHSYEGYEAPIERLRTRVGDALSKVNLLMARQGHLLEVVAIDELTARRERLEKYRDQARFALADSYDRATKARTDAAISAKQAKGSESATGKSDAQSKSGTAGESGRRGAIRENGAPGVKGGPEPKRTSGSAGK